MLSSQQFACGMSLAPFLPLEHSQELLSFPSGLGDSLHELFISPPTISQSDQQQSASSDPIKHDHEENCCEAELSEPPALVADQDFKEQTCSEVSHNDTLMSSLQVTVDSSQPFTRVMSYPKTNGKQVVPMPAPLAADISNLPTSFSKVSSTDETKVPSQRKLSHARSDGLLYDKHQENEEQQYQTAVKRRKSVTFADYVGKSLVTVKTFYEPSHVAPQLSPKVLERFKVGHFFTQTISANKTGSNTHCTENTTRSGRPVQWEARFCQPASDYAGFREKIETNNISLENAFVNTNQGRLKGSIKVKNISFKKQVFLRVSINDWLTHQDSSAYYVNGLFSEFDTFCFDVALPHSGCPSGQVQFCVCFKGEGFEYWDNNGGMNYTLSCKETCSWW